MGDGITHITLLAARKMAANNGTNNWAGRQGMGACLARKANRRKKDTSVIRADCTGALARAVSLLPTMWHCIAQLLPYSPNWNNTAH